MTLTDRILMYVHRKEIKKQIEANIKNLHLKYGADICFSCAKCNCDVHIKEK